MKHFLNNAGIDYIFKDPECYPLPKEDFTIGEWMRISAFTAPASQSEHMEDFLNMSGDIIKPLSREKYIDFIKEDSISKPSKSRLEIEEPTEADFRVLIDNERITARMVLTYESTVKFGKNTKWCVSDRSTKKYYNSYSSRVDMAILESQLPEPLDKVGMLIFENGTFCLFDKKNCIINDAIIYDVDLNVISENRIKEIEEILSPELMDSIYNDYSLYN